MLIEGEPGIGKSALVRAAVAERGRGSAARCSGAPGDELGQALPLLPFLDGLRVREPSANPRRNTIVRLLRGEGAADRGADVPAVLAEQLLALVAEQCAVRPTILVIDDLQWADQASVTLWGRLARSARQVPLLLIGTMRPVPQRDDLLALRRAAGDAARLQLTGLTEAAVADLVAALAGGKPDGNLLRLADGAAGNPLYLTELVAALTRSSRLTDHRGRSGRAGGRFRARLAVGGHSGPPRLRGRAGTRGAAGGGPARRGFRGAGPGDRAGPRRGGPDPGGGRGVCRRRAGRVRQRPRVPASADPGGAVRRDAGAGARRLAPRCGARPGRGGRAGRTGWPGSCCGRSAGPADRRADGRVDAELAGRARRTRWSARRPRWRRSFSRRAVASSPAGSARHDWLAGRLADALYRIGDLAEAERVANRALEHAAEPDLVVDLHWTLAQCRMLAGRSAESLATLDRALASPGISARHRARLLVLAARTHSYLGEVEKAGRVAANALAAASEAGDNWAMGWALHVLTLVTSVQGHMTDALPLFDRALAVTQADPALTDLRLLLQINKAVTLGDLDRYEEAFAAAGQARHLADQVGTAIRLAQAHGALGQLLFDTGRWDDALAEVEILPEDLKEPAVACVDLGIAAVIGFHRGEIGAARRHLAAAVPHAKRIGAPAHRPAGRSPAAWTASRTARCRRRWPR